MVTVTAKMKYASKREGGQSGKRGYFRIKETFPTFMKAKKFANEIKGADTKDIKITGRKIKRRRPAGMFDYTGGFRI